MNAALSSRKPFLNYINILKARETLLLTFIGACSVFIAADGHLQADTFILALIAIVLGSAGANGLTNYLDRTVDARMKRTCTRALAAERINPPQKALPLIIGLMISSLVLAWVLHPFCFFTGLIGFISSGVWRKTISCTFFGIVAGCAPVLIGWFAVRPEFDIQILLICCLVAIWIPIHVWSVIIANRQDYANAGLNYFPLNWKDNDIVKILLALAILLFAVSILLYLITAFNLIYLVVASILGILMVYANIRLIFSSISMAAWKVYKLSAFPYLGVIFLAMCLDVWLM